MSDCPDGKMDREKMKKMFNMVMTNDDSSDKDSGVRKIVNNNNKHTDIHFIMF